MEDPLANTPAPVQLSDAERKAIRKAIKGSIDLYRGYVKLNPEHDAKPSVMKRKQTALRADLIHLQVALAKLR
jgi:hypothetical protein